MISKLFESPRFWRHLVYLWTIVLFALILIDFIHDNLYVDILGPVAAVYTAVLGIYSAEKEFRRWHHDKDEPHPGEVFVLVWTLIMITIFFADIMLVKPYAVPGAVTSTYIVVLGILAVTKQSKKLFRKHCVVEGVRKDRDDDDDD